MTEYQPGSEIAGYRIESVIGRGGMAVVYRAEDTRLGRKVALKLLTPALAQNDQFRQRFIRESRLAASLDHPNIVPIYEAGEADGQLFIAMRYVVGSDLKALLEAEGGPLPPAWVLWLFVQVGDALDAAHRLGLVHRDVKPGNILVASGREQAGHANAGHVYLSDFGLTKRTTSLSGDLTGTGHFLGTVNYVSPEQIQGAPVGPSSDIYALGCVLYECLTGQLPFRRDDDAALLWAHLIEPPPPVSAARPDLPAAVDDVVARAMAKSPDERYASCYDLVRDLEAALSLTSPVPRGSREAREGTATDLATHDRLAPVHASPWSPSEVAAEHPSSPSDAGAKAPASAGAPPAAAGVESVSVGTEPTSRREAPATSSGGATPSAAAMPSVSAPRSVSTPRSVSAPRSRSAPPGQRAPRRQDADKPDVRKESSGRATPGPEARRGASSGPSSGRRRRVVVALAAVLAVLLVGATVQLVRTRTSEQFTHYTSTNSVVHYSLDHPADWRRVEDVSSAVVFSPRVQAISTLFFGNGAGTSWTGARQLLRAGAADAVGLYVYSQESDLKGTPPAQFRQSVTDLSPLTTTITSSTETTVSGAVSDQIDAVIADPGDPSVRLGADIYVCQPATGGLVVFTFVAAPDKLDSQEPVISRVLSSVKWLPPA